MIEDIRNNLASFYQPVSMPGGWSFDHVETLRFNHLYYYGKYNTGNKDAQGYYKFFHNITKPTCDIATKFVDLDTKDIVLIPEGGSDANAMYTWFMHKELRTWLKQSGFAKTMNEISFEFPKGHVVLKKIREDGISKFKKVPIVSMRMDPAAPCLDKTWHGELHMMTIDEIEAMGWDTEEIRQRPDKVGTYDVYEMYVKEGKKWRRTILAGVSDVGGQGGIYRTPESRLDEGMDFLPPIVLLDDKVDRTPYRELKWEHVEGRWLGFGFPEYLKDNQIAENEAENLERKALVLKALQLYQTSDETIAGKNVLTDTMNGDILIAGDIIAPVAKDNADLSAYNNTRGRTMENIQKKTFTTDITTGANLPSRTPLGVANLQASLATSYFDHKREDEGLFIKDLLWDDIIPDFKKKTAKQHAMDFIRSDEDRRKAEEFVLDLKKWEFSYNYINKTGFVPTLEEIDKVFSKAQDELKGKESLSILIPDRAYNDAKYRLDITITGEEIDVSAKSNILQIALQIVGSNPMILQDETTRTIFLKFLGLGGYTLGDLNIPAPQSGQQMQMPQGGSVATPQPNQTGVGASSQMV
jgi:hypothetical protein